MKDTISLFDKKVTITLDKQKDTSHLDSLSAEVKIANTPPEIIEHHDRQPDVEGVIALTIPIVAIIAVFTFLIIRHFLAHKERMKIIEKGGNLEDLYKKKKYDYSTQRRNLSSPFILVAVGSGLILGYILKYYLGLGFWGFLGSILICLGIGIYLQNQEASKKE